MNVVRTIDMRRTIEALIELDFREFKLQDLHEPIRAVHDQQVLIKCCHLCSNVAEYKVRMVSKSMEASLTYVNIKRRLRDNAEFVFYKQGWKAETL